MNEQDMNSHEHDMNESGIHRRLRHGLGAAAESVDASSVASGLADIQHTARHRTRRRNTIVGVTSSVVVVALVGMFATIVGSDDEAIQTYTSTPPTTEAQEPAELVPDPSLPADPMTPAVTVAPQPSPDSAGEIIQVAASAMPSVSRDDDVYYQWLLPWHDGFIAAGFEIAPTPLPDVLTEELAALFPDEINDLFPDGLPATQNEALDVLSEAGLFGVALDVINANPDLQAAFMPAVPSAPPQVPEMRAETSPDGVDWDEIDITLPEGLIDVYAATSTGDRLVVAGRPDLAVVDARTYDVVVASTTDLQTWDVSVIPMDVPAIVPDSMNFVVWARLFSANEHGWVVMVERSGHLDLLDDNGHSSEPMPNGEGMSIMTWGTSDQIDFTWDELGIDPALGELLDYTNPENRQMWAGTWDGAPVRTFEPAYSWLSAIDDGFVAGMENTADIADIDRIAFSTDGLSWTPLAGIPDTEMVTAVFEADDEILVVTTNREKVPHSYRFANPTAAGQPVDLPGLPRYVDPMGISETHSGATVVEVSPPLEYPYPEVVITAEHDGFQLTTVLSDGIDSYELVEAASGEVVASEVIDLRTATPDEDGRYENRTDSITGLTIFDAVSGDEIVTIPYDVWNVEASEAWEAAGDVYDDGLEYVLLTTDGDRWMTSGLDRGAFPSLSDYGWGQTMIASNGETIVMGGFEFGFSVFQLER